MKRLWWLLLVLALLLTFTCTGIVGAEEKEIWKVEIGEETYLITKAPETGLRYIPETTDLNILSDNMAAAVRANPVSAPDYIGTQIDFWFEVLKRFALTAHPNVVFMDGAYGGLEVTVYEQPKWCFTWGKAFVVEDGELGEQPSFVAIETKEIPLLADVAEIFTKIRLQGVYLDKQFWFGLAYEFTEE